MANAVLRILHELKAIAAVTTPATAMSYMGTLALNGVSVLKTGRLWHADKHVHSRVPVTYMNTKLVIDCDKVDRLADEEGSYAFSVIREMYARNVYLWCFQPERVNFDFVVDAGGNRGLFTTYASQLAQQVIYIEPLASYRKVLNQLLSDNPSSCRVHVENTYLSGDASADAVTMDDLVKKYSIQKIGFMKCDVEGAEFSIFSNCENWLPKVENLALEVHPAAGSPAVLVDLLRRNGFDLVITDSSRNPVGAAGADYIYGSRTGAIRAGSAGHVTTPLSEAARAGSVT